MKRVRVLVVDDDSNMRQTMDYLLTAAGYEVFMAESGYAGFEIIKDLQLLGREINLLITDYHMTNMNGIELVKTVRNEKIAVPVLLTSGYGIAAYNELAQEYCSVYYIEKPFEDDAFVNMVRWIISRRTSSN